MHFISKILLRHFTGHNFFLFFFCRGSRKSLHGHKFMEFVCRIPLSQNGCQLPYSH